MYLAYFRYSEAAHGAKLLDNKTRIRLVQHKEAPTREGNKPSACIHMDCIKIHNKLSGHRAGDPVRVGTLLRWPISQ